MFGGINCRLSVDDSFHAVAQLHHSLSRKLVVCGDLTEGMIPPLYLRLAERSRIVLHCLALCGTKTTGLIFKFGGILFLISPYLTTVAYPLLTLSATSAFQNAAASGEFVAI